MIDWIITNCESVGNVHEICQDYTCILEENKVLAGALADGVSSNKHSDIGARIATKSACAEICAHFKDYYSGKLSSKDFVKNVQARILEQSGEEYRTNEIKSTLLLCAVRKDQFILGHIGDGAILCFGKESFVISPPQENEVGGAATYTMLDYNAGEHFSFNTGTIDDYDGFLLTSDGLLGNLYYSGTDIPQLAFELFGAVYQPASPKDKKDRDREIKNYLAEYIQAGDSLADDCSLLMIARAKKTGYVDYSAVNGFEPDVKWPCNCGNMNRMGEIRCSCCRNMYTEVFPQNVVRIVSKESFFSKLNQWFSSNSPMPFSPGRAAEIINDGQFNLLCNQLKKVVELNSNKEAETAPGREGDAQDDMGKEPSRIESIDGRFKSEKPGIGQQLPMIQKVRKIGAYVIDVIKTPFSNTPRNIAQTGNNIWHTTGEENKEVCITQVSFSRHKLLQAAYYKRRIPAALLPKMEDVSFNDDQLAVINVMFNSPSVLEILANTKSISGRLQVYHDADNTVCASEKGSTSFSCKYWRNNDSLLEGILLPDHIFKTEIHQNPELRISKAEMLYSQIQWNWWSAFRQAPKASEMERKFCEALKLAGTELEPPIATQWFIADCESCKEMLAYIVANSRLLLLKSVGSVAVTVNAIAIDDKSALLFQKKLFSEDSKEEM